MQSVRRIPIALAAGIAVAALAACGSGSSTAKPEPTTSTSSAVTSSTTIPPAVVEGRTKWVDVTERWKAVAANAFKEGPEAAAEDLAALWRGGDTSEVGIVEVVAVQKGEPAVVTIRERDVPDEAVAAVDYELTLEPGDEGWVLSKARAQYACRRAIDPADATHCR